MQGLRTMRSVANVTGIHLQALQARSPLAATPHAQALQRFGRPAAAALRKQSPVLAAAASYQTAPSATVPSTRPSRVFTEFAVYKGKGVMCVKVGKPEWQETASGDISLARPGAMFLEFALADTSSQQSGYGERRYDWTKKQIFALSAHEIGSLIASNTFNFIHDPNKNKPNEGTVLKTLRSVPMTDGTGVMLTIQVKDPQLPGGQWFLTLPITDGELAVIKSVANYIIPHILGFSELFVADSVAREPHQGDSTPF